MYSEWHAAFRLCDPHPAAARRTLPARGREAHATSCSRSRIDFAVRDDVRGNSPYFFSANAFSRIAESDMDGVIASGSRMQCRIAGLLEVSAR